MALVEGKGSRKGPGRLGRGVPGSRKGGTVPLAIGVGKSKKHQDKELRYTQAADYIGVDKAEVIWSHQKMVI